MTTKAAAHRYARALFDVAIREQQNLDELESQLAAFVDLFRQHPALEQVMLNPAVPAPRKRAAVSALITTIGVTPILGRLLTLLAERDRLVVLTDLLSAYRTRLLDHRGWVRADVTTAVPLSGDRAEQIERRLKQATGKGVTVTTHVDPSIIGGIVTRIGGTVYDSSVARQLEKIKDRLGAGA